MAHAVSHEEHTVPMRKRLQPFERGVPSLERSDSDPKKRLLLGDSLHRSVLASLLCALKESLA